MSAGFVHKRIKAPFAVLLVCVCVATAQVSPGARVYFVASDGCVFSRGRYLVALGRSWHPEEFTCSQCKAVLEEGGFFEERGSVYCTKCHDNRYAPNCAKCKKKITGVRAALWILQHVNIKYGNIIHWNRAADWKLWFLFTEYVNAVSAVVHPLGWK